MLTFRYEINEKAVRKEFVENGVYYRGDNGDRWLSLDFDATALTKEDRQLILDKCTDVGNGDFIYESRYFNVVCRTISEVIDVLKEAEE